MLFYVLIPRKDGNRRGCQNDIQVKLLADSRAPVSKTTFVDWKSVIKIINIFIGSNYFKIVAAQKNKYSQKSRSLITVNKRMVLYDTFKKCCCFFKNICVDCNEPRGQGTIPRGPLISVTAAPRAGRQRRPCAPGGLGWQRRIEINRNDRPRR